jgi:hypothetical protein
VRFIFNFSNEMWLLFFGCVQQLALAFSWSSTSSASVEGTVSLNNDVTIFATTPDAFVINSSVSTIGNLTHNSTISLTKSGELFDTDDNGFDVGDILQYTITVENIGSTALSQMNLTDTYLEFQSRNFTVMCSGQPTTAYGVSQLRAILGNISEAFRFTSLNDTIDEQAALFNAISIYNDTLAASVGFTTFPSWLQAFYLTFSRIIDFYANEYPMEGPIGDSHLTADQNATAATLFNQIATTLDQTDPMAFTPINLTAENLNGTQPGAGVKVFEIVRDLIVQIRAFNGNTVPVEFEPADALPIANDTDFLSIEMANVVFQAYDFAETYLPQCAVSCSEMFQDLQTYAEPDLNSTDLEPGQSVACTYFVTLTQDQVDQGITPGPV